MSTELAFLKSLLDDATAMLPDVVPRRLFGCDGYFTTGNIFAMVWKDGRIGLKLPDDALEAELRAMKGSASWSPGGKMVMTRWVLVPESFHDDTEALAEWTRTAHRLAFARPPKPTRPAKAAPKKPAPKPTRPAKAAPKKPAPKKPAR